MQAKSSSLERILAVDDEPGVRRIICQALRRAGYAVFEAENADQAESLAASMPFSLALVDYRMPGRNGLELLERLRDLQPACGRILISGHLDLPIAISAVNGGEVSRVLAKPLERGQLLDVVRATLSGNRRDAEELRKSRSHRDEDRKMLEDCLHSPGFRLALQPIVTAFEHQIIGYEALIRSTHPELDAPTPILNLAEQQRMIREVGNAVVARAVEWLFRLPPDARMFINLHPEELDDVGALEARLEPLVPWSHRIVLEITGRSHERQHGALHPKIERMRDLGFAFALDDIGAGQGALVLLAEASPDFIKADISIVRNLNESARKRRLVEMLQRFAAATGGQLIAEGVETPEEAAVLEEIGVPLLQGYLFARPSLHLPTL